MNRPPLPLSRRTFLRLALATGIGAGVATLHRLTRPAGIANGVRWLAQGWQRRMLAPPSTVAVVACPAYDDRLLACLAEGWDAAGGPDVRGRTVFLKPNLADFLPRRPITTDARLLYALVQLLYRRGARRVTLGDGTFLRKDPTPILHGSGLTRLLNELDVDYVDLNHADLQALPMRGGFMRRASHLYLPRPLLEADVVVSVPKMKTHHWTGVSLSLKNMFGIVPGIKYGWPKNILHVNGVSASIAALYASIPFDFAVVDGIVGMEGDGPLFGEPVPGGVLVFGRDGVAVDATCARLMGIEPAGIEHLDFAAWVGLGLAEEKRLDVRGARIADLRRAYRSP